MSLSSNRRQDENSSSGSSGVEQACHEFLESWKNGKPIAIGKLLSRGPSADRQRLLRGMLIIELRFRRQAGEDPSPNEYKQQFPDDGLTIDQVFELTVKSRRRPKEHRDSSSPAESQMASARDTRPRPVSRDAEPAARSIPAKPVRAQEPAQGDSRKTAPPKQSARKMVSEPSHNGEIDDGENHNEEIDEFASLLDVADERPQGRAPVVRKKKKESERSPSGSEKKRRKRSAGPNFEFLIPIGMLVASLAINLVVALVTAPEGTPASWYLLSKLGFTLASTVVTTGALVAASALFGITYGYLNVALIKIPAIVLTQAWVGDLLELIPVPFLGGIIAWLVTFYLFVTMFELDHSEAIESMFVVRIAHILVYWLLFAGFMSWVIAGKGGHVASDAASFENALGLDDNEEGGRNRPPRDGSAEARSLALTQKFGDALLAQDYPQAYALMSPEYQASTTLDQFSALHRKALVDYGKPLKATAGLGDDDAASLRGADFNRFSNVPPESRFAWTYAELALELEDGESVRCCDCWLLIVKSGDELRVGAFEYGWCD